VDQSEEEQVEALRRWWDENGKSTMAAVVIALASGFGWTAYKDHQVSQTALASDLYQSMQKIVAPARGGSIPQQGIDLGEQLKREYSGSTYAQFAALHLAAVAVERNDLTEAEAQLRWVLGRADKGSDAARVAQLRLARVLAASGDADQALAIIQGADAGSYGASYAAARGDILLTQNRVDEAREAYSQALELAATTGGGLPVVAQKLESLMPAMTAPLDAVVEELQTPASVSVDAEAADAILESIAPDDLVPDNLALDDLAPDALPEALEN
jgi:predicted negative regulator of RcsB-dependent stress response